MRFLVLLLVKLVRNVKMFGYFLYLSKSLKISIFISSKCDYEMLKSLEIRNFKNLRDLQIGGLGNVNLITGKNNTGKSTLLEALSIYASQGNTNVLFEVLVGRGEVFFNRFNRIEWESVNIFESISSLFPNRKVDFRVDSSIIINGEEPGENGHLNGKVAIRFVKYFEERDMESEVIRRIVVEDDNKFEGLEIGLEITANGKETIYSLSRIGRNRPMPGGRHRFQTIDSKSNTSSSVAFMYDAIALSEKEGYLVDALRIIEPQVVRVAFVNNVENERKPIVKLENSDQVFPLQSMGDGMNRILSIVLAMANAENGFLLVDEFENGLHYSVQEKLWEIIFHMSKKLNIQVFATTHSEDCIRSFEAVLNEGTIGAEGKIIRLENRNGHITSVGFNAEELKIVTDSEIEIR